VRHRRQEVGLRAVGALDLRSTSSVAFASASCRARPASRHMSQSASAAISVKPKNSTHTIQARAPAIGS
jgi:hypothetical protein